jgi:hypothetical protein
VVSLARSFLRFSWRCRRRFISRSRSLISLLDSPSFNNQVDEVYQDLTNRSQNLSPQ